MSIDRPHGQVHESRSDGSASVERRTVYFTMVHTLAGPVRVGPAYSSREVAEGWLDFVKSARSAAGAHVDECTLTLVDGQMDPASVDVLDRVYNMDPPDPA